MGFMLRRRSGALGALLILLACQGKTTISSPIIRVDLRDRLSKPVFRRLIAADLTFGCSRKVKLASKGAHQELIVSWRVFDYKESKYITALEVEPSGETTGATGPQATASVGDVTKKPREGGGEMSVVPLRLTWAATSGCEAVEATHEMTLVGDDPGCQRPKNKIKILGP